MFTIEKKAAAHAANMDNGIAGQATNTNTVTHSAREVNPPLTEEEKMLMRCYMKLSPTGKKNMLKLVDIVVNFSDSFDLGKWVEQHTGLSNKELAAALDRLEQELEAVI